MQLQYENHTSLVLEVYGIILASMLFFGLILTTFTGKVHIFMIFYLTLLTPRQDKFVPRGSYIALNIHF